MESTELYKIVEHVSDASVTATGKTLEEAFANTASGMFFLMADLTAVDEKEVVEIKLKGTNLEEVFYSFLDDFLYRFEVQGFLPKRIEVKKCTKRMVEAVAYGEEKDKSHHIKREIKSVTYHRLKVEQGPDGLWKTQVTFDV